MTRVVSLIDSALTHIPFRSEDEVAKFLKPLDVSDQCALITAMYVGRDHIHDSKLNDDVLSLKSFNRYHVTGDETYWFIHPVEFARILYEKNSNLSDYFSAFLRCAEGSEVSLNNF